VALPSRDSQGDEQRSDHHPDKQGRASEPDSMECVRSGRAREMIQASKSVLRGGTGLYQREDAGIGLNMFAAVPRDMWQEDLSASPILEQPAFRLTLKGLPYANVCM
jgi:hypothetical protein